MYAKEPLTQGLARSQHLINGYWVAQLRVAWLAVLLRFFPAPNSSAPIYSRVSLLSFSVPLRSASLGASCSAHHPYTAISQDHLHWDQPSGRRFLLFSILPYFSHKASVSPHLEAVQSEMAGPALALGSGSSLLCGPHLGPRDAGHLPLLGKSQWG